MASQKETKKGRKGEKVAAHALPEFKLTSDKSISAVLPMVATDHNE